MRCKSVDFDARALCVFPAAFLFLLLSLAVLSPLVIVIVIVGVVSVVHLLFRLLVGAVGTASLSFRPTIQLTTVILQGHAIPQRQNEHQTKCLSLSPAQSLLHHRPKVRLGEWPSPIPIRLDDPLVTSNLGSSLLSTYRTRPCIFASSPLPSPGDPVAATTGRKAQEIRTNCQRHEPYTHPCNTL